MSSRKVGAAIRHVRLPPPASALIDENGPARPRLDALFMSAQTQAFRREAGGAGGLERGFAEALAAAGAEVIAADIQLAGAEETARLIVANGGKAHASEVDVASETSTRALAEFAEDRSSGVDALVNNAAIYAGLERTSFETIAEIEWDRVMRVNVKGVCMTRGALKRTAGTDDMVGAALVFASPAATFITGQTMIVDGGRQFN
jgi:NAD(P)-dependent dehydrogenase (short-subunit alcohol dehydrogenase family)